MLYGHTLHVSDVNEALPLGIQLLQQCGNPVVSRGMATVEYPGPVSTVYSNPRQRVLFDEVRDANPFFHLMESLWIISGSQHVALPKLFLNSIDRFSDDGVTFHGAYGYRLRTNGDIDQMAKAIQILRENQDSRQVVLSIWDAGRDLGAVTKDMPCNDMVMLKVRDEKLNMTVCNRSNDIIWGAYGANAVQFSMVHEWLAAAIGVGVGYYVQQSDSYHAYEDNAFWQTCLELHQPTGHIHNPYLDGTVRWFPLVQAGDVTSGQVEALLVQRDCEMLDYSARKNMSLMAPQYHSPFFRDVVMPVVAAYAYYKDAEYDAALEALTHCRALDWRLAMGQWITRRQRNAERKGSQA